jgi:hypothetical protein
MSPKEKTVAALLQTQEDKDGRAGTIERDG